MSGGAGKELREIDQVHLSSDQEDEKEEFSIEEELEERHAECGEIPPCWNYYQLPFHIMNNELNIFSTKIAHQNTPWKALFLTLSGTDNSSVTDISSVSVCDLVFHQDLSDGLDDLPLRNWMKSKIQLEKLTGMQFTEEVKGCCRLYGVHYLWFSWLYYMRDTMVYDAIVLDYLSQVFIRLCDFIITDQSQITEELFVDEEDISKRSIDVNELYAQRLIWIVNVERPKDESAVRMYHLASIAEIPQAVDFHSESFEVWKTWGQQYVDYFFDKKLSSSTKKSDVKDRNTEHYLRFAKRLGCQPRLKHWEQLLDEMLSSQDEEQCEADELILVGFVKELKTNTKLVMRHRNNEKRMIVEKIADYILKHPDISPSRKEIYEELQLACPEVHWQILLSSLIPHELSDTSSSTTGREIISLSGSRFFLNQTFEPSIELSPELNFSRKNKNNQRKSIQKTHSNVRYLQNHLQKRLLSFKINPEFPIIEQAGLELMYGLFGYPGIPFSEVMRMNRKGSSLFLVSEYVDGIRADEVFSNADHADIINNLDEQRVGELIIYSILSNPEDGRLQNYIFVRSDRDASLYKIVAIDIDHSFAAAIPQKFRGWFSKETKTSSMLFTLPLMSEPIAESIQERLRSLNVEEVFTRWIDDLERLEHQYRQLYSDEEERAEYETTTLLTLPMNYARLMHVYWKLKELKSFVVDYERTSDAPQPTYMEALKRVEKYTGDRYEAVNQSTMSVGERFRRSDGRLSSSKVGRLHLYERGQSSALDTILDIKTALRRIKKKIPHELNIHEFEKAAEEFKKLSSAEQEELFLKYQPEIRNLKNQQKWLDLISEFVCEWRCLIIRHFTVLTKKWFANKKTAFYNLALLELHDCSEVTGEVLNILNSQKNCRLEGVILSSLENLRTLCAWGLLGTHAVQLPYMKSIRFVNNVNLKRIHINSPQLRHLMIEGCSKIECMSFGDVKHLKTLQYDKILIQNDPQRTALILRDQVLCRKMGIYSVSCGCEAVYTRLINGKLVFRRNKYEIGSIEFPFRSFANTLEGELNLYGLQYHHHNNGELRNISDDITIHLGYRKRSSKHSKTEVWIVPKFLIEKNLTNSFSTSSKHYVRFLPKWASPIGIFFTNGDWGDFCSDSRYCIDQSFDQLQNQNLYQIYQSSTNPALDSLLKCTNILAYFTFIW